MLIRRPHVVNLFSDAISSQDLIQEIFDLISLLSAAWPT